MKPYFIAKLASCLGICIFRKYTFLTMNKIFIILLCSIFVVPAHSQRLRKWTSAADSAYTINDHKSAIRLYRVALTYDSTLTEAKYRIAESARIYKAYEIAIEYYQKIIENQESLHKYPLAEYHLAGIYTQYGKYNEAISLLESFVNRSRNERAPGDKYVPIARKEIEYSKKARERISEFALFDGRLQRIDTAGKLNINTPRSDFGLVTKGDTLFYTSIRNIYKDKEQFVKRRYAEIFKATENTPGQALPEPINKPGQHVANLVFNTDQTRVYYSVCENIDVYQTRCDIYYRDIVNGIWGREFKYPHNVPDFSSTQPNVGLDKSTNEEILFFASDRLSDTIDRKDIFYSVIEGPTEFSAPQQVPTINTPNGDEMSPFFDSHSQNLYYSTDGDYTFGGTDIYKITKIKDRWINKLNLGTEVNSSYNDAFFHLDSKREYAYLATDREESLLYDPEMEACCFDIYRIPMKQSPEVIIVKTFDAITNEPLFEVTVPRSIVVQNGGGEDKISIDEITNETGNTFNFGSWSPTDSYLIEGKRERYYDTLALVNMIELLSIPKDTHVIELKLMPKPELQVFVFEKGTNEPIPFPDFVMEKIQDGQNNASISNFRNGTDRENNSRIFPIELNTNYFVKTSKSPFIPIAESGSRLFYDIEDFKRVGAARFKDTLYLAKLPDFETLLPDRTVPLYFENDWPKMGRVDTLPRENYMPLYQTYKSKKQQYVNRLRQSSIVTVTEIRRMSDFFTRELEDFKKLDTLVQVFVQYMDNGFDIEIELRGYASPIGNADYNLKLSKRRIECIRNLLLNYNGGVLKQYLNKKDGRGGFVIKSNPKGEEEAPPTVRNYLSDINASIFSYLSSLERRVDIFLIDAKQTE